MNYEKVIKTRSEFDIPDVRSTVASFRNTDVGQLLCRYGHYESYEFPYGDTITVLPTCSIPLYYLARENWNSVTQMGNTRGVMSVDRLTSGIHPHIIIKSPERIFTKDERLLSRGYPWWGGVRTLEGRVGIVGNRVVEEQTIWEVLFLLELNSRGLRAEIPQALIQTNDRRFGLVVNEIDVSYPSVQAVEKSPTIDVIRAKTGLIPAEDWQGQNILSDSAGRIWIIDVNRWAWPPYTDDYRKNLVRVISETKVL